MNNVLKTGLKLRELKTFQWIFGLPAILESTPLTLYWHHIYVACKEVSNRGAHGYQKPSHFIKSLSHILGFPGGTSGEESTCQCRKQESQVRSLDQEDPLGEETATHFSILVWRVHGIARNRTRLSD